MQKCATEDLFLKYEIRPENDLEGYNTALIVIKAVNTGLAIIST